MTSRFAEDVWASSAPSAWALRIALTPASWLYGAGVALRNRGFDAGLLESRALALPAVSVGNLTVGGTGKTPVAAWLADRLSKLGARPGILLRGYGDDEPAVHRRLVPGAIIVPGADRVAAAVQARDMGATVLVMDDAFQHRRVRRDADVVLVSADRDRTAHLLPAGPWREPLSALRRATHVVVTRKQASLAQAQEVVDMVARVAPEAAVGVVHLVADAVVRWDGAETRPLATLAGRTARVIAGIGDPRTFESQVCELGLQVAFRAYGDHHAFSGTEVAALAQEAAGVDLFLCTLKDAVKLGPVWPSSAPPIWYLSQRVNVEFGAEGLEGLARRLATSITPTNDSARWQTPAKEPKV